MPNATGTTTVTPFELTLADGSVVKAENQDEALKTLAKMKVDTASALKQERDQSEQLRQQNAMLQAQLAAANPPTPRAKDSGFDNDHYWALYNSDPMEAQNYLDAHRFGIDDPKQVPLVFNQMRQEVSSMQQQAIAAEFYQQHIDDFPREQGAIKAVSQRFQALIGQGFPANAATLDFGYQQLIGEGAVKPNEAQTQHDTSPNPALSGAGAPQQADSELQRFEKMGTAEQEAYLRSKGMMV